MRQIIIAGNWKMNKDLGESEALAGEIKELAGANDKVEIVVCPTFTNLSSVNEIIKGSAVKLGAQNMYPKASGAFTGEISVDMLKSVGCDYVIIGHSERRQYFGETDASVNEKVRFALENGIIPIMCIGETLEQRESDKTFDVIDAQLSEGLAGLTDLVVGQGKEIILAYEPVWAIGTGKVATPEQAQEVHKFIRGKLAEIFGQETADKIRIQYGGSVKPDNAKELMGQADIDGALIGGAALKADSFVSVIELSSDL